MTSKLFTSHKKILAIFFIFTFIGNGQGQNLNPAIEQEFIDAKAALQTAQAAKADKYAPDKLKKATELLTRANRARLASDEIQFSQTAHMARALAELATFSSELKIEREKLLTTQIEIQKIKDEIQRLQKAK